jgi:hypothetical protein
LTCPIPVKRGVKQGSVLSPLIFNNVLRTATRNIPPYIIDGHIDNSHLSYADDILLLADKLSSMERAFEALQASLSTIGLAIEPSKTEFMIENQNEKTFRIL